MVVIAIVTVVLVILIRKRNNRKRYGRYVSLNIFTVNQYVQVVSINVRQYRRGNLKWTIQRNWQHRITKTQDEDKQNTKTKHNMCWKPPYTRRRQTKQKTQHNMCWTPPYTRHKMNSKKLKHSTLCVGHHLTQDEDKLNKKHSTICAGHHLTQDTRRRQTKQKTQHNMCWTSLYANKHKKHK